MLDKLISQKLLYKYESGTKLQNDETNAVSQTVGDE
jgi:hypothetical protein